MSHDAEKQAWLRDIDRQLKAEPDLLKDQYWRLNNLYWITNKEGQRVQFKMNPIQEDYYWNMHNRNVILKARQFGFTTLCMLIELDITIFVPDKNVGFSADTKENALDIFQNKFKYAYENLPDWLKERRPALKCDAGQIVIDHKNGRHSSLKVAVSLRSGTYQWVHVSEYGKLSAHKPEAAQEVKTGTFNAVPEDGFITVESTAEGMSGQYYNMCQNAIEKKEAGTPLTNQDYKFFFYGWWQHPDYASYDNIPEPTPKRLKDYFDKLYRDHNIKLSPQQKKWYVRKEREQQDKMKQEYPATPEEAFEQSIEGAYYTRQLTATREGGRICRVPHIDTLPVQVFGDLGISDASAWWFLQEVDRELWFIDYLEVEGWSLEQIITEFRRKPYKYIRFVAPHDIRQREMTSGKTRQEIAREKWGLKFDVAPSLSVADGIDRVREIFPRCLFDEENCEQGIKALTNYKKKWDERLGCYLEKPLHNWASHGADAFRMFGVGYKPGYASEMAGGGGEYVRQLQQQAQHSLPGSVFG